MNIVSHKNLYMNICSSFIYNRKKKPKNNPTALQQLNKLWCIHTMEYYLAIKKEQAPDTHKLDKNPDKLSLQKPLPRHS